MKRGSRFRVRGYGLAHGGVLSLDCWRKMGERVLQVQRVQRGWRGILIVLRAVVIPSVAEGSFLHCGQYHISTDPETTPWCYVFLLSHILRLAVCKKDFSLRSK